MTLTRAAASAVGIASLLHGPADVYGTSHIGTPAAMVRWAFNLARSVAL
jgi:hypothetical protein